MNKISFFYSLKKLDKSWGFNAYNIHVYSLVLLLFAKR